jgi:hypothetical protein
VPTISFLNLLVVAAVVFAADRIILLATSLGLVVPVLKDAGGESGRFGQLVIAGCGTGLRGDLPAGRAHHSPADGNI